MKFSKSSRIISFLLFIIIVLLGLSLWLDIKHEAVRYTNAILFSLITIMSLIVLTIAINKFLDYLSASRSRISLYFHRVLGLKPHKRIHEVTLLKVIIIIGMLFVMACTLLIIWSPSIEGMSVYQKALFSGFTIFGIKISIPNIVIGLFVFIILSLLGRLIATRVAKKEQLRGKHEAQVAIATIIQYIGFTIAIVAALMTMGIDFTGLAIIAGALSVGVGLGLQGIANNFISGIIILLEKPIKPGDRILIDNIEGFVKKVRVRSTQVTTLAREDVIIPNADLVTKPVTNYMFRDQHWRVVCAVGVAYGSDVELVRKLLLGIAHQNDTVIREEPNEPSVIFKGFGESSLDFELWCIINDVNKKYKTISDLNFAIDKAFREHDVTIAFPQRDIHIKNSEN